MILQKLSEYAERIEENPPVHFDFRELDWIVEVGSRGEINFIPLEESDEFLYAENIVGRAGLKVLPRLLGDKAGYVFGNVDKNEIGEFSNFEEKKFRAFYELIEECWEETDLEKLKKVLKLRENREELDIPEDMDKGDWLGIRVEDEYLLNEPIIQKFWQQKQNEVAQDRSDMVATCLICGEEKTIADRHPEKLQMQRMGGQGSGSAIVSANNNAFESYGLEASFIAPVCFDCGIKYGRAANYLLNSDKTESNRVWAGNVNYIFWRQDAKKQNLGIGNILSQAEDEKIKEFIKSYYTGNFSEIESEEVYILALTANQSRVMIRDWIVTTLEHVRENLVNYFESMQIGYEPRYFSLPELTAATAFDNNRIKPIVVESLINYSLNGLPLDFSVLNNVIRRNTAEAGVENRGWKAVSHARAALLKMYFNSKLGGDFKVNETLDKDKKSDAYLCGRLFAVIERIQTSAMPGIKSTVVDKYYGTASTAPASVFGNLLRKAQHHLAKMRKDESKQGIYYGLQRDLEDIMAELEDFPSHFTLQEQGKFALGYYQQRGYRPSEDKEEKEKSEN